MGGDQSWKHHAFDSWRTGFLEPVIQRGAAALVPGGHWVLNIADVKDRKVTHPLVQSARQAFLSAGLVEVETLTMPLPRLNRSTQGEPVLVWRKP